MTESDKKLCLHVLSQADIFSSADMFALEQLLCSAARVVPFAKEEVLYSPASTEKCIGVLLQGEARVEKDYLTVSVLKPGGLFGAVTLYNAAERFVNTVVAKTACKVVFLQKDGIDRLIENNPIFAKNYIGYLSKRIYFLNEKIEAYTAPNGEEKLLHYLKSISSPDGIIERVCVTELARQINVSRAGIYRALEQLSASGKLLYGDKKITILEGAEL
ncbi:MAG: Crp/Fnr family transcriptional regulator [Clostridia bacterium]|nr:Crp/Fnr family transcriptional regulator [Clostridia bacterium]